MAGSGTVGYPQVYLPPSSDGVVGGGGYPLFPPGAPAEDDEGGILARLRRRKFTFLSVFVLVLGAVAGAYFVVPHTYRTTASVGVSYANIVLGSAQAPNPPQTVGDPADLESQTVMLTSTPLLRLVLSRPGIRDALVSECEMRRKPPVIENLLVKVMGPAASCTEQVDDTPTEVAALQDAYIVSPSGRSRVLDVSYASPSAQISQVMTNTLVQTYLDLRTGEKLKPRDAAISWLRGEISRLGDKLKASEQTIEAFLSSHNLVKGQTSSIASERLSSLSQQLATAQGDQAAAAGRMGQTSRGGGDVRDVLDSRSVSDIKQQLDQVNGQLAQMTARYGSAYPGRAAIEQQRAGLQGALAAETGRVVSSVNHDYQAATNRVNALSKQLDLLKAEVGSGDNAMTQIAALQRDTDVDRELYLDLTKRVNELEAERRLVVGDAQLVNYAELPDKVFFPKKTTFGLTGLLLATALATVTALLRDRADGTVRALGSLQSASGLRVLAHIPQVRRVGTGGSKLARQLDQPSAFQEAIRGLYAECMLVDDTAPPRTMLVTSSHSGEGKTFVTLALAHFAAAAGKRVLVLEGDLRQPSFAQALSLSGTLGLNDYLRGKSNIEEVITPTGSSRLDVIMAGHSAMNSTELLSNRRMRQLLEWASGQYDLVLLDTPPSQVLRDARVLARHVDAVLYCAQWGESQMASVLEGVGAIQAAGGNVLGLVIDRVQSDKYRLYNGQAHAKTYYALQAD